MSKTITVYWCALDPEWLRAEEPVDIYKNFIKNSKMAEALSLGMCPGFKDYSKNYFGIKSIYDYDFTIKNNEFSSTKYDQTFFKRHISIRSLEERVFSFNQHYIFFTEEESLNMSCGILPFLEDNNITTRCVSIPGQIDIGKWFRVIDFAFILKENYNEFKIKEGEIFQYINFETDAKIKFKQFGLSGKLNLYKDAVASAKENRKSKIRDLSEYYQMMKMKKSIIEEIKSYIIE
jgi:hypothetical protein